MWYIPEVVEVVSTCVAPEVVEVVSTCVVPEVVEVVSSTKWLVHVWHQRL